MQAPNLSVLLPAYNAEATIAEAVESILAQSFVDFELLVIDDGSTDATAAVLSHLRDTRLRLVRQAHAGIAAALNTGLAQARGRFIARMDADDRSHPDRLRLQMEMLAAHPELAAVGCLIELFPADAVRPGMQHYVRWLNSLRTPEGIAHNIFVEMPLLHPSMLLRRDAFTRTGSYRSGPFPEDYELLLRMYAAGLPFGKVPAVLYFWREHPAKLSRTHAAYSPEAFRALKITCLHQTHLRNGRPFRIWGAGRDGRRFCRELQAQGCAPLGFVDIDPRKIGHKIRGLPVLAPEEIPADGALMLVCVGARGARETISRYLQERGWQIGQNFLCAA